MEYYDPSADNNDNENERNISNSEPTLFASAQSSSPLTQHSSASIEFSDENSHPGGNNNQLTSADSDSAIDIDSDNTEMTTRQHSPVGQSATISEQLLTKWFRISKESLLAIKGSIEHELELGLRDEDSATIKMLITYVRELSRGDEIGSYLALDLGGTHFRVLLVTLNGDGSEPKVISTMHDIPQAMLITQNGQELFDYIAVKLLEFVQHHKLKRRRISLGFTFSFPCKQYGLTQSILVKWCKGFSVGGVIGTDVVKQLKNALKRQLAGLVEAYIDVVAVINDTTGTLVACANKHRHCRIGLIVGTGFNACYIEQLDKCDKWPANYTSPKQVIINCEWGALGDNKERRELDKFRNEFDTLIDKHSVNPHNQTYEKMVAGMYVGELLRLAMLKLIDMNLLFKDDHKRGANKSPLSPSTSVSEAPVKSSGSLLGVEQSTDSTETGHCSPRSQHSPKSPHSPQQHGHESNRHQQSHSHKSVGKLSTKDILNGKHLSMLAKDEQGGSFNETVKIMKELHINKYTESDMALVIKLAAAIMTRAAKLVACGISALLDRMQQPFTIIGYDGSVIKHHPYFLKLLTKVTGSLTNKAFKFEFVQSSDGSGIGAAVVAAALHKERRPIYVVKPGKLYEMHLIRTPQSQLSNEPSVGRKVPKLPPPGLERVGSASSRASSA